MPFEKGKSGNPNGRPRQSAEQNAEKGNFQALLKASTVSALESIIQIANDEHSKDRFNACKFIIDKAYGKNTAILLDSIDDSEPIIINIVPGDKKKDDE